MINNIDIVFQIIATLWTAAAYGGKFIESTLPDYWNEGYKECFDAPNLAYSATI